MGYIVRVEFDVINKIRIIHPPHYYSNDNDMNKIPNMYGNTNKWYIKYYKFCKSIDADNFYKFYEENENVILLYNGVGKTTTLYYMTKDQLKTDYLKYYNKFDINSIILKN